MSEHRVAEFSALAEGTTYPITIDDVDIVLVRQGDSVYALEDRCSHADIPLAQGRVLPDRIKCLAHGAEFCIKTGKALVAPAFAPVKVYPVRITDGDVSIILD